MDKIDKSRGSMSRSELLGFLRNEKHLSQIPEPNFAVETGSGGYHLYYLLERLPGSMQKSVQALKLALHERFIRLENGHDYTDFFCGKRRSKGRKALTQLHMRLIASLVKAGKSISKIAKELALSISLVKRRRAQMMREDTLEFYTTAASSLPAVA